MIRFKAVKVRSGDPPPCGRTSTSDVHCSSQDVIVSASSVPAAREKALRDLADLHGEMVLLIHWSMLNYAAVCKILKKHDKRTGMLLRSVRPSHRALFCHAGDTNLASRFLTRGPHQSPLLPSFPSSPICRACFTSPSSRPSTWTG